MTAIRTMQLEREIERLRAEVKRLQSLLGKSELSLNAFKEGHTDAWGRFQELSSAVCIALTSSMMVKDQILKAALLGKNAAVDARREPTNLQQDG